MKAATNASPAIIDLVIIEVQASLYRVAYSVDDHVNRIATMYVNVAMLAFLIRYTVGAGV